MSAEIQHAVRSNEIRAALQLQGAPFCGHLFTAWKFVIIVSFGVHRNRMLLTLVNLKGLPSKY